MKKACLMMASALLCIGTCSVSLPQQTASADIAQNNAYCITATGTETDGGNTLVYTQGTGDVEISFDMLKNVENGYFGVVFTFETGIKNFLNRDNYTLFSAEGTQVKSASLAGSEDFVFVEGYSYKITFSKAQKTMAIASRAFGDATEYTTEYSTAIKAGASGVCGLAVMTENARSATVVIDNLYILEDGKKVVESDFDKTAPALLSVSSHEGGCADIYDRPKYRVVFVDENGEVLQERYVCQYNYAVCNNIPEAEGKYFFGWSQDVTNVQKDLIVYPIYTDENGTPILPEIPEDSSSSEEDSSVNSATSDSSVMEEGSSESSNEADSGKKSGCKSVIGLTGIGFAVLTATASVMSKKEEEK